MPERIKRHKTVNLDVYKKLKVGVNIIKKRQENDAEDGIWKIANSNDTQKIL